MKEVKNILSLNGSSWLIHDDKDDMGYESIKATLDGFVKATVPGNIQDDLEKAHLLSHPIWSDGFDNKLYAVATKYWWYKREFEIPAEMAGKRLTIYFDGVDFGCDVYINDKHLGHHEGTFERFEYDITDIAVVGGVNSIWVKIDKMPDDFLEWIIDSDGAMSGLYKGHFFAPGNNLLREMLNGIKPAANLSYDWSTNVYSLGLWKDVYIKASGDARIDWVQVKTHFADETFKKAKLETMLEIEAACDTEVTVDLSFYGNGKDQKTSFTAKLSKGMNVISGNIEVEDPLLWWPNGYGEQPLYFVNAVITDAKGSDEKLTRFGFRDVKWAHCEGCPEDFQFKYRLVLNGTPIRMLGSNFTLVDLLPGRIKYEDGRHFIEMAKKCDFNYLRFHGGSWGHQQGVFDDCDELGLMIMNEYPIGNLCIPNKEALMEGFDKAYTSIVKDLRNHPSIVEWGGGNELEWYFNLEADRTAMYRAEATTNAADSTRHFRFTEPVPGARHAPWDYNPEVHYKMYNSDWPDNFDNDFCMCYGEFSTQSNAHPEVWYRDIADADRWPIDEKNEVLIKKNIVESVFTPNVWWYQDRLERFFYRIDNLEMGIKGGQWMGAEGIRYAVDALRSKGKLLGKLSTWDFNEPFSNGGGPNVIDFDGRPFMAYYFLKQAMAPVSVSLKYDEILFDMSREDFAEVVINCDTPKAVSGLTWKYRLMDRHGRVYEENSGEVSIAPMEVKIVDKFKITPDVNMIFGPILCEVSLTDKDGKIVNERYYVFGNRACMGPFRGLLTSDGCPDNGYNGRWAISNIQGGPIDKTSIAVTDVKYSEDDKTETAEITIKNTAERGVAAIFCEVRPLIEYQPKIQFSDNYVSIPAGESRTITAVRNKNFGVLTLKQVGFTVDCWNAESAVIAPDDTVILNIGRKDDTNRGFDGALGNTELTADGANVDAATVPYMIKDSALTVNFKSSKTGKATLWISTVDTDDAGMGRLEIDVNGHIIKAKIPEGAGFQEKDRSRRAYTYDFTFELPEGVIAKGDNKITVKTAFGYIALDTVKITL